MSDIYDCRYCDGVGCEECGGTGQRVTTWVDLDDGVQMRVHGSMVLSDDDKAALAELGRAALERIGGKSAVSAVVFPADEMAKIRDPLYSDDWVGKLLRSRVGAE